MRGDEYRKIGFSLRVLRQAQQDTSARQAGNRKSPSSQLDKFALPIKAKQPT
jgi:hypothetical protein